MFARLDHKPQKKPTNKHNDQKQEKWQRQGQWCECRQQRERKYNKEKPSQNIVMPKNGLIEKRLEK